jgi:hypothetical protein
MLAATLARHLSKSPVGLVAGPSILALPLSPLIMLALLKGPSILALPPIMLALALTPARPPLKSLVGLVAGPSILAQPPLIMVSFSTLYASLDGLFHRPTHTVATREDG